ncbi:hypothetical protein PsorP6_000449 [Peronosclerospora sorghi]|uniref:Uncharacterized protein n=1 Tax=Peronosclerospora sorghi TaxID=230839 RepID=A0ACC0WXQ8_9STRA|nr:hypothetical protein PsorP6_000449 [Peronosclerospora sorghi]
MESKQPQTSAQVPIKTDKASNVQSNLASQPSQPPVSSVLHPITPEQPPLNPALAFRIKSSSEPYNVYEESFPQYGKEEPGQHYRLENNRLLAQPVNREENSVLIICVFNDAESWGKNRTIVDFFELVKSFNYPKEKVSIALLTSSASEYVKVKEHYGHYINLYPRLSVIFRNDFALSGVTRENRHSISLQANRRRMIARYRNYALMLTLETWHQHVVWLDADIKVIPPHLLSRMVYSGLDILTPACYAIFRGRWMYYDQNAWLGQRIVRPPNHGEQTFLPGPLNVAFLSQVDQSKPYTPLDSVGGTMLYVRADVHRQGVLFPVHYIIGSEWGREGYDGIESEGLCYIAHFLGFKCWGMANETIVHTDEK